ncbi:MAG: hypothetical protein IJM45_04110 [Clostridia bacterium]|nr:hypothetical protein [Clostridia bacterium]
MEEDIIKRNTGKRHFGAPSPSPAVKAEEITTAEAAPAADTAAPEAASGPDKSDPDVWGLIDEMFAAPEGAVETVIEIPGEAAAVPAAAEAADNGAGAPAPVAVTEDGVKVFRSDGPAPDPDEAAEALLKTNAIPEPVEEEAASVPDSQRRILKTRSESVHGGSYFEKFTDKAPDGDENQAPGEKKHLKTRGFEKKFKGRVNPEPEQNEDDAVKIFDGTGKDGIPTPGGGIKIVSRPRKKTGYDRLMYDDRPVKSGLDLKMTTSKSVTADFFKRSASSVSVCMFFSGLIFIVMLMISVIASATVNSDGTLGIFGGNALIMNIVMQVLLFASLISTKPSGIIPDGFEALKLGRPDSKTGVIVIYVLAIIQNIVLLFVRSDTAAVMPLSCAAAGAAAAELYISLLPIEKTRLGVNFTQQSSYFSGLIRMDDAQAVSVIGGGELDGAANVNYFGKIALPKNYVDTSMQDDATTLFFVKVLIISAAIGVAAGVADFFIHGHNFVSAFTLAIAIIISCIPTMQYIVLCDRICSKKFNKHSAGSVTSYAGAVTAASSEAMVVEAKDLYSGANSCRITNIRFFTPEGADVLLPMTAYLLELAESPLAGCFKDILDNREIKRPRIEDYNCESGKEISAMIDGRRALLCKRDKFAAHTIDDSVLGDSSDVLEDGSYKLYLAVNSELKIEYTVHYDAIKSMKELLKELSGRGIEILLCSDDCLVTDRTVENDFDLPQDSVVLLNSYQSTAFRRYRERAGSIVPVSMFSKNDASSRSRILMRAFDLAYSLRQIASMSVPLCVFIAAGVAAIGLIAGNAFVSGWLATAMRALSVIICFILTASGRRLYRSGPKRRR